MENRCAMVNTDFSCGRITFFSGNHHWCAALFFSQVRKKCTDLDPTLLNILISRTYTAHWLLKIVFQRSAFAFHTSARALAAGLPHQDHFYITADESFRFHNDECNEIP